MANATTAILSELKALAIDMDASTGEIIVGLQTALQSAAAVVPAEDLQKFIAQALVLAGRSAPVRPQTTHMGELTATAIRVDQFGLAEGQGEGSVVIAFPVGQLTVAFEIGKAQLIGGIGRFLSEGGQAPAAPKPN